VFVEVELLHLALILNAMDVQLKCLHLIHELILDLHLLLKQLASLFIDMPVNLVEFTHHLTTLLVQLGHVSLANCNFVFNNCETGVHNLEIRVQVLCALLHLTFYFGNPKLKIRLSN
jgi:hypothetical protein